MIHSLRVLCLIGPRRQRVLGRNDNMNEGQGPKTVKKLLKKHLGPTPAGRDELANERSSLEAERA